MKNSFLSVFLLIPLVIAVDECLEREIIHFTSPTEYTLKTVNFTNCSHETLTFYVIRPVNSTKSVRVTLANQLEIEHATLSIIVFEEYYNENGQLKKSLTRKGFHKISDAIASSPNTSLRVQVTNIDDDVNFKLNFTLEENGCPFPFLESANFTPIIILTDFHADQCDFAVRTLETKSILSMSSVIRDRENENHDVSITVYDGITDYVINRVSQFFFDSELEWPLGTPFIIVHVENSLKYDRSRPADSIIITPIVAECECPVSSFEFENFYDYFEFKITHSSCARLKCTTTLKMKEELRHDYRIKVIINNGNDTAGAGQVFAIRDGFSKELFAIFMPRRRNETSYVSVHPEIDLIYHGAASWFMTSFRVFLIPVQEAMQKLCVCPKFYTNGVGKMELEINIDISCGEFDCLWTVPHLRPDITRFRGWSNNTQDSGELLYRSFTRYGETLLVNEVNNYSRVMYTDDSFNDIIHYQRKPTQHGIQRRPTYFNLFISSNHNKTEYQNGCGCYNNTIPLNETISFTFTSPRFPRHYCDVLQCITQFVAPEGYRVAVQLDMFSLQKDADFLTFYDVFDEDKRENSAFTGTLNSFEVLSRSNVLVAVFKSDEAINYDGFNATVSIEQMKNNGTADEAKEDEEKSTSWSVSTKVTIFFVVVLAVSVGGFLWRRRSRPMFMELSFNPLSEHESGTGMVLFR